jgi:hypothetical protein
MAQQKHPESINQTATHFNWTYSKPEEALQSLITLSSSVLFT